MILLVSAGVIAIIASNVVVFLIANYLGFASPVDAVNFWNTGVALGFLILGVIELLRIQKLRRP